MSEPSLTFPSHLYPAVSPLPIPMANHLLHQEERKYRRAPTKRPQEHEIIKRVLERIIRARSVVFHYLSPFVLADKLRQQRGSTRSFPEPEWLLETLAAYTPHQARNAFATLDYWQKKGLIRREKTRGLLDITSVAALLIARLSEENLQKNWLPSEIEELEPRWWCYGLSQLDSPIQSVPLPSALFPASTILWTPWLGAIWEEEWQMIGDGYLYRWAGSPTLQDLEIWDTEVPASIQAVADHVLFGRPVVQAAMQQEAATIILTKIVQKGVCHGSIQSLLYQPGVG